MPRLQSHKDHGHSSKHLWKEHKHHTHGHSAIDWAESSFLRADNDQAVNDTYSNEYLSYEGAS